MNLRDKLSRLDKSPSSSADREPDSQEWVAKVESDLRVKVIREGTSFFFLKESIQPLARNLIPAAISREGYQVDSLKPLFKLSSSRALNLKHILFIDTETTGLAGGTGTYPFLIGVGHIELDSIVVRQYLLPDFSHEWLMLKYLDLALHAFDFTLSFNGKTFDIPLLKSRFILNRMDSYFEEMEHLDLLHASRRIWRNRLGNCNLQNLEKEILDIEREEDLPGYLIPQIYFEFLRRRHAWLLIDVLEHNYYDIVNMILLTLKLSEITSNPVEGLAKAEDLFSLGKFYFQNKCFNQAASIFSHLISDHRSGEKIAKELQWQTRLLFSRVHKSRNNYQEARKLLDQLIAEDIKHPSIIEELAKIYEHKIRDVEAARKLVETGIQYLEMLRQLDGRNTLLSYLPSFKHRHQRLLEKVQRQQKKEGQAK